MSMNPQEKLAHQRLSVLQLTEAQVARLHPAAIRRQPRMLRRGVDRLTGRFVSVPSRRRLAAMRLGRHLLRLIAGGRLRGVPVLPVRVQRHSVTSSKS